MTQQCPPCGGYTIEVVTNPLEWVELTWALDIEVSPLRPASMSGPEEGGVEPADYLVVQAVVACQTLVRTSYRPTEKQLEVNSMLDRWEMAHPLDDNEITEAMREWYARESR